MLSTFVSELTSLVNSDSAWKVSKGRRSASRRNRNTVRKGTENCASVILGNPEHSNMPVSESEKRGISVLGCTFNDKVEHLPIKKRRSLLRNSSSPPPPPSSPPARHDISVSATNETAADISKNQDASNELEINPSHITDNNISNDAKKYIKSSEISGCDEDFSGISILAAAACSNNSSGKEFNYAEEHSCVEECSIQEQSNETCIKTKESSFSEGLVNDEPIDSREILRGGASSCVSVEPVGELLSLSTSVSSLQNLETVEKRAEGAISRDVICSKDEEIVGKRCLSSRDDRLHWDLNVMMDDWEQSFEDSVAHNEVPHHKSDDGENGNNICDLALDVKSSLSCAPCELEKVRSGSPFGNASAGIQTHFCNSSDPDTNKEVTPHLAGTDNVEGSLTLHDEETSVGIEKTDSKTNEIVSEISLLKVELTDYDESSKYEALTTSDNMKDVSVKTCEIAPDDREIQQVTSKEICDSLFSDSCKANTDNNNNNNLCFSDKISNTDGAYIDSHSASVERVSSPSRLHEGYDSQYEDGELRETNECEWTEYCGGNDTEHMVCEQDMETCSVSPVHFRVPESGQVDIETNAVMEVISTIPSSVNNFENEGSTKGPVYEGEVKNEMNSNSLTEEKADVTRSEQSREIISRSSLERVTEVGDGNEENVAVLSGGDVLVDCGGSIETKIEAKSYKRGLRSQIEAPVVAQDGSCRDERLDKVENRYEETSCVRSSERIRYPLHGQGRGRDLKNWNGSFDGRRGFKRRYSPIYHGRLKGDDDGITERDGIACIDSPNDSSYALHSRCKPQRKFSPDNNRPSTFGRDRPFRYGPSTGGRGRYNNGPPSKDEIFQSSLKYRRPLSHRERSPSPFGVRAPPNAYHSRGKSPSRSRSRSPLMWAPQRGRPGGGGGSNTFIRHRSRSPNFRSEVRVQQRTRSPIHHQPGFTGERTLGFRSFPRNNYNSPPHSRWASSRKDESGHFRDFGCKQPRSFTLERSPGRNIKRTDRVIDSLRNMKPDGYYRISEEGTGREFRYEDNYEDRRKHYGTTTTTTTTSTPLCPNRRNFDDGMNNRLHQDMNDGFSGSNIRDRDTTSGFQGRGMRGMGCRIGDLPRLREGKFNSDSKQFIPDIMDSSSDMPSEEPFQSQQGRFPVVEGGPSRGRRYENYEDRRKPYGGGVFTEKRTNHFFDRNFEDGSFYPRRGVRNFDGQVGSLATRLGEQHESVMSRKEEKLEENAQSFGGGNSDEHDIMPKGRVSS